MKLTFNRLYANWTFLRFPSDTATSTNAFEYFYLIFNVLFTLKCMAIYLFYGKNKLNHLIIIAFTLFIKL